MARTKLIRMKIDGERLAFKQGNPPATLFAHIEAWTCPHCLKKTGKCKILLTHIQFGFNWDDHVDYFKCKCGQHFYCPYIVILEGE